MRSFVRIASLSLAFGLSAIQVSAQEAASASADTVNAAEFNELIKGAKWDEAAALIDDALKANPDSAKLLSMSFQLANQTMRTQPEASEKRYAGLIAKWSSAQPISIESARSLSMATSMLGSMLMQKKRLPEAIEVAQRSLAAVTATGDSLRAIRRDLESMNARFLMQAERKDEALKLMRDSVDNVKTGVTNGTDDLRDLVRVTNSFSSMFDETSADEVNDRNQFVESLLLQKLDSKDCSLNDLSAYLTLRSSQMNELTYSNPAKGIEVANEVKARLEAFPVPTDANEIKQLDAMGKSLKSMASRLESSMVRERLVGTVAPEYEAQSFVGMEETTLAGLKGKVVLLDFWAVWCGPCIATFPHLRDWHDAYADKGFAILGMTSDQGFVWDEDKKQAVRGTDVSHEQELEMLVSFRKHHELRHGFVLTPKGSEYNKQLAVSGIPQAVLLDKQGVVRMIKVGSGPQNAKALEEMIEKLLAEETKPADGEKKKDAANAGS